MPTFASNAALLIIDLQVGINHPRLGPRNNPEAELRVGELLAAWRISGRPVVHVRHISREPDSVFRPGQSGCEFQPAFTPLASEAVFEKHVPDAFCHTGLERWLHVRGISELVIVGVSTNNSVESTARTAGNLGFDTGVVADACYTFDLQDRNGRVWPAEDVHTLALTNLAMDYARILDSAGAGGQLSSGQRLQLFLGQPTQFAVAQPPAPQPAIELP